MESVGVERAKCVAKRPHGPGWAALLCVVVGAWSQPAVAATTIENIGQADPRFTLSAQRQWMSGYEEYYFTVENHTAQEYRLTIRVSMELACAGHREFLLGFNKVVYLPAQGRFTPRDDWYHKADGNRTCARQEGNSLTLFESLAYELTSIENLTLAKEEAEQARRLEKEQQEKDRLEKVRLEKERQEKDKLEKERLAKARQEKEQQEKERLEAEQQARARAPTSTGAGRPPEGSRDEHGGSTGGGRGGSSTGAGSSGRLTERDDPPAPQPVRPTEAELRQQREAAEAQRRAEGLARVNDDLRRQRESMARQRAETERAVDQVGQLGNSLLNQMAAQDERNERRERQRQRDLEEQKHRTRCGGSPAFSTVTQRGLPSEVEQELVDPAECGLGGAPRVLVPYVFSERVLVDFSILHRGNRTLSGLSCQLESQDTGQVWGGLVSTEFDLPAGRYLVRCEASPSSVGKPFILRARTANHCDFWRQGIPMVLAGETATLSGRTPNCAARGPQKASHLVELDHGAASEGGGYFEHQSYGLEVTLVDLDSSTLISSQLPRFWKVDDSSWTEVVPEVEAGPGALVMVLPRDLIHPPHEDRTASRYHVYMEVPAVGSTRQLTYQVRFSPFARFGLGATLGFFNGSSGLGGGASFSAGLVVQATPDLGLDLLPQFNILGAFGGTMKGYPLPLLLGVRFGRFVDGSSLGGFKRVAAGPAFDLTTMAWGATLRLDWAPFFMLHLSAQLHLLPADTQLFVGVGFGD